MGTRSTTRVYQGGQMLLALYCQFDGNHEGVGQQLADFIQSRPVVNGISGSCEVFNGMECFAAQLVAHLKAEAGLWYVTGREEQREEFNYEIHGGYDANCSPMPITFVCEGYGQRFQGKPEAFKAWAESLNDAEEAESA